MTRDQTLSQFYPLIMYLAKGHYFRASPGLKRLVDLDDLIEEGVIGAILAIDSHDPNKGKLTAWVKLKANGQIVDSIRRVYPIPQKRWEEIETLMEGEENLLHELGREPSEEELAAYLRIPVKSITEIRSWTIDHVDLESTPIVDEQEKPYEVLKVKKLVECIYRCISLNLSKVQGFVWVERNIYACTGRELAQKLKLKVGAIYKIEAAAKTKLKTYLRNNGWQDDDLPAILT